MSSQKSDRWDKHYSGDTPAWEIGSPQPVLVGLASQGWFSGRLLDIGCGTGEHTILAAEHGADALGVDVSQAAIRIATEKARLRGVAVRFVAGDALCPDELGGPFDVVVDSGLFHVFDEDERPRYARSLAAVLRCDGILHITCISDRQPGDWGPHRISEADLRGTFTEGWVIDGVTPCIREIHRPEINVSVAQAWLARIRRVAPPVLH